MLQVVVVEERDEVPARVAVVLSTPRSACFRALEDRRTFDGGATPFGYGRQRSRPAGNPGTRRRRSRRRVHRVAPDERRHFARSCRRPHRR